MDERERSCYVEPPYPPCYPKPVMRRLHYVQTMRVIYSALALSCFGGLCVYAFLGRPRKQAYKDYYEKNNMEQICKSMIKKGVFQSVPKPRVKTLPAGFKPTSPE